MWGGVAPGSLVKIACDPGGIGCPPEHKKDSPLGRGGCVFSVVLEGWEMCARLDDWEYLARPAGASLLLWAVIGLGVALVALWRGCVP